MRTDTLPVAEIFASVQGEGAHAGEAMWFLRLAGCNVGRYKPTLDTSFKQDLEILDPRRYAECQSFTGQHFICDTDFRIRRHMTMEEILEEFRSEDKLYKVSITGGEPLIHKNLPLLLDSLSEDCWWTSIETSGTLPLGEVGPMANNVVCSPKQGFLEENVDWVTEFKMLVGDCDDLEVAQEFWNRHHKDADTNSALWFVQPINPISTMRQDEFLKQLVEFSIDYPHFRLSLQTHKLLGVR